MLLVHWKLFGSLRLLVLRGVNQKKKVHNEQLQVLNGSYVLILDSCAYLRLPLDHRAKHG